MSVHKRIFPRDINRAAEMRFQWSEQQHEAEAIASATRSYLQEHHYATRGGKRNYHDFSCAQTSAEEDGGDPMDCAPDRKSVVFTPPNGYYHTTPMEGIEPPKPSIKQRIANYDHLPTDYKPEEPFTYDLSDYVDEEEQIQAEEQKTRSQHHQTRRAPFSALGSIAPQPQNSPSASALGLSGLRRFTPPQTLRRPLQPVTASVIGKRSSQFDRIKLLGGAALDRKDSIPSSIAARPKLTPARRNRRSRGPVPPASATYTPLGYSPSPPPDDCGTETLGIRRRSSPRAKVPSPEQLYPALAAINYNSSARALPTLEAQEEEPFRRISGMAVVTTLANYLTSFITGLYDYIRGKPQKQEIIAVATDISGAKRRAIAAQDVSNMKTPSPQPGDVATMPGYFPGLAQESDALKEVVHIQDITPPDSRPGSQERQDTQRLSGNAIEEHPLQINTTTKSEVSEQMPNAQIIPRHDGKTNARAPAVPPKHFYKPSPYARILNNPRTLPHDYMEGHCKQDSKTKDNDVDNLVKKAKKVTLETEEEKTFRQSYRTRKQRIRDAELEREREAQAKLDAEREAEEERQRVQKEAEEKAAAEAAAKARKAKLIRPLTEEWEHKLQTAMEGSNMEQELAQTAVTAADLTRHSFAKLLPQTDASGKILCKANLKQNAPSGWLNDEIVNGWIECILEAVNEKAGYVKSGDNVPEVAAFNSGWLHSVKTKGNDIAAIKTWSRRQKIKGKTAGTKEYKLLKTKRVFFPINSGSHWMLMIIDVENREIQILDSLGGKNSKFFRLARDWLSMELESAYDPNEWTESKIVSQQQKNYDDCGVFTCINALASATGAKFTDFGVTSGMADVRRMMGAVLLNGGFKGDWEL